MKFKILISTILFSMLFFGYATAQEQKVEKIKKAKIVKKTIDKNGNEQVETIILEGDAIDEHLKNMDLGGDNTNKVKVIKNGENTNIWITKDGEKINLEKIAPDSDSKSIRVYKFEDGEEIPKIKEGNVEVEVEHSGGEKIIKITRDGVEKVIKVENNNEQTIEMNDGDDRIIIISTDGDENEDIEIEIDEFSDSDEVHEYIFESDEIPSDLPFIGIMMNMNVSMEDDGNGNVTKTSNISIDGTVPNSPAEQSGLQKDDLLIGIDDQSIDDVNDVTNYVEGKKIGDIINLKILRTGENMTIPITLGKRPTDVPELKNLDKKKEFSIESLNPENIRIRKKRIHRNHHRVKRDPCKPFIGVSTGVHQNTEGGLEILRVIKNTPADRDGLLAGDLILEMDGQAIDGNKKLRALRDKHDNGDRFKLLILRNGKIIKVKSSFDDCPEENKNIQTEIEIEQPEAFKDIVFDLNLFPNPSDGNFNLTFRGNPGNLNISISDITGKQLYSKNIEDFDGIFNEQINITSLADGTVLVKIENEGEVIIEKMILQSEN